MERSKPLFCGKDVARVLGYTNPQKALRDHVVDDDKTVNESFTVNGTSPILINESGLYSPLYMTNRLRFWTWPRLKSPILLTWKIWIATKCWKIEGRQNQHLEAPKQALLHHESALFSFKNVVFWGSFKTPYNQQREILWHHFWRGDGLYFINWWNMIKTIFKATSTILHSMVNRSFARWPTDGHGFFPHAKAQRGAKNGILI